MPKIYKTHYIPREQQKLIHRSVKENRFTVVCAHRRFGKTMASINQLIHSAVKCDKPNPRFAYISPTYKQSKIVAFDMLKEFTRPLGAEINIAELRVDFLNGRRISLYGADNPDSLRGIYLDGCIIDEVAQVPRSLWTDVVRPALADRKGWALFIGTPAGQNYFK